MPDDQQQPAPTTPPPLSAEQIAKHFEIARYCGECGQRWPCDASTLAASCAEREAQFDRLRVDYHRDVPELADANDALRAQLAAAQKRAARLEAALRRYLSWHAIGCGQFGREDAGCDCVGSIARAALAEQQQTEASDA